jgi:hypothetical protein
MHFSGRGGFPSQAVASEDRIDGGVTLQAYIESQIALVREFVLKHTVEMGEAIKIAGADEAMRVVIRYQTDDGRRFYQCQIYARSGLFVGDLTLTTLEDEFTRIGPVFASIISAASFNPSRRDIQD